MGSDESWTIFIKEAGIGGARGGDREVEDDINPVLLHGRLTKIKTLN